MEMACRVGFNLPRYPTGFSGSGPRSVAFSEGSENGDLQNGSRPAPRDWLDGPSQTNRKQDAAHTTMAEHTADCDRSGRSGGTRTTQLPGRGPLSHADRRGD